MRRHDPLATRRDVAEALVASPRRPGLSAARSAFDLAREGTDSARETTVRLVLAQAGLPEPTINLPILGDQGEVVCLLDMAYDWAKLALEYDGAWHADSRAQKEKDTTRRRWLEDAGWRVMTITDADLRTGSAKLVRSIRLALENAAIRGAA
jgi:hypothetical protein